MSRETLLDEAALIQRENALRAGSPSYMLRPKLSVDGNQWCALFGESIQDGLAGFGNSPEEAYADFDRAWSTKLGSAR